MKLGLFTDSHYCSKELVMGNRYPVQSLRKIRQAMDAFRQEKCDLVICLGDVIDSEPTRAQEEDNLRAVAQILRESGIPTVVLMGNHDADVFTQDEFYAILGESCRPRDFSADGKRFVFVDGCYSSDGSHYEPGKVRWYDSCYPYPGELADRLAEAHEPVHLFMHQIILPDVSEKHMLCNAEQVRSVLAASGKVRRVYHGHYHLGYRGSCEGIEYLIPPAVCMHEEAHCIEEI